MTAQNPTAGTAGTTLAGAARREIRKDLFRKAIARRYAARPPQTRARLG
jgi:hypothetical protein